MKLKYSSKEDPSRIVSLYKSGLSSRQVSEALGDLSNLGQRTISRKLKKMGIERRTISEACRKYKVNHNFFEIIDTEEKAYWLGFIAADGCLSHKCTLKLKLCLKDKKLIEIFKEHIEATYPLYYRSSKLNGKVYYNIALKLSSEKIYNDLIDKGITPRKSLTLKPPKNVPEHLIHHWIRGYFDGDGCVHVEKRGKLRVSILGTKEVLGFILKQTKLNQRIETTKSKTFRFRTSGLKKGLQFYHYIYNDATIYLERKKEKFEEYIRERGGY